MEAPGFITLLYIMYTLPSELGIKELPWGNKIMAGCFVCHPPPFPKYTKILTMDYRSSTTSTAHSSPRSS